ncbi:PRKCI [Cordylochernes scorpioides]|uniref:PRKCI n=1 Tax=Cordylochernes scorpioides TaxID=51811 RepID=A0ABY6LQD4_9ARAC|nr:PRKCI [Cordylochernes scorpioides]
MPGHRKRRQFKQTDAFTRGTVIGLKRAGWSIRQIAADTHLGASTVHRLWRRWLEQGNVAIYRNVGATRVTSARVDRRILRQAVAAPQATCTAILQHVQDTLDHSISTRTISRRLVANGLHSCRPLRRLPLTPPNRRQRLEWCRARSTWMTEWHRVVFSDESRFCLSSDSRRVRVWRRRGERSNPAAIVERPTVRQRGIMVWGAIAYDSRSPLLRIQGTMTAQRYVDDVLRPVTLPYLQGVPNALYQQDNARPHTARISQQALQDVQMLPWPPYSPDLSPIEHVWDIIGRRLHALPQPRSEDELWQMVEREWRAIPQDAIRTLIDSLPRRVAACIAVRVILGNMGRTFSRRSNHGTQVFSPPKPPNALRKFLKKFKRNRRVGPMTERLPIPELPLQIEDITEEEEPCQTAVIKTLPYSIPTCTNDVLNIEDFERILTIGKGGFGRVFLARHKESEEFYALKAMKKRSDFRTEREVLQIAKGFPFLMGLVTSFETPEEDILVMDLVKGFNFHYYLNKWENISENDARFYTAETALALHCLHSHNIIHRDVKLGNILLNYDGHIKLVDYGLCKLNIRPGQKTSRCCGTLRYMAPEVVQNKPYDFSVDWWSLGATLYEMLVGKSAFEPPNEAENNKECIAAAIVNKPIDIPDGLSNPAVTVLQAFMTREPESRLGSHPDNGWGDIKRHPFYRPLDFNEVLSRNVPPPFIPRTYII